MAFTTIPAEPTAQVADDDGDDDLALARCVTVTRFTAQKPLQRSHSGKKTLPDVAFFSALA